MTPLKDEFNSYDLSGSVGVAVVVLDVTWDVYLGWLQQVRPELRSVGTGGLIPLV